MKGYKDYSVAFARSLILKTPPALREVRRRKGNPRKKTAQRKNDLLKKPAEAEQASRSGCAQGKRRRDGLASRAFCVLV